MKALWTWLCKEREFPGPLRYLDVFKLRRLVTLKRLIIFLCVVVVVHQGLNEWAGRAKREQLKRARSASAYQAITFYNQPELPAGENAGPLYRAAFELVNALPREERDIPYLLRDEWPDTGAPDRALKEKVRGFVGAEPIVLALQLIERANRMPRCNWGLRYQETFAMTLPHLHGVRHAAYVLLARARLRYVAHDRPGAVDDLHAVVQLAQRIESDRLIISEVVQYALLDLWVTAVRQVNTAERLDPDTATRLLELLGTWDQLIGTTEALKVETMAALSYSARVREEPEGLAAMFKPSLWSWKGYLVASYVWRPVYRLDQAHLLRYELDLLDLSRKPYWAARQELDALTKENASESVFFPLTRLLFQGLPWTRSAPAKGAKARAQVSTTRLGLALEVFRAKTGSYPRSLDALVPNVLAELPVDPFTGKPLVYRLSGEEVLVYSVGNNGRDDGGLTETERAGKKLNPGTDDVAWRVSRGSTGSPP